MSEKISPDLTWEEEHSLTYSFKKETLEELRSFVDKDETQESKGK
jgi:hypothetical protein